LSQFYKIKYQWWRARRYRLKLRLAIPPLNKEELPIGISPEQLKSWHFK
jgi:hypothetical protein